MHIKCVSISLKSWVLDGQSSKCLYFRVTKCKHIAGKKIFLLNLAYTNTAIYSINNVVVMFSFGIKPDLDFYSTRKK